MRRAVETAYCGVCRPLIPDFFEGADGGLTHSRANVDPCGRVSIEVWRELRLLASTEGVGSDALRALESLAYRLGEDAGPLLRALRLTLLKFPPRERRCLAGEQRLLGYVEELLRAGADPREAAESLLGARKLVVVRPNGRLYVGRPLLRAWGVEGEYVKVGVQGRTALARVVGKGLKLEGLRPGLTELEISRISRRELISEICKRFPWTEIDGECILIRPTKGVTWRLPLGSVRIGSSGRTAGPGVMRADIPIGDLTLRLLSNGRSYVGVPGDPRYKPLLGWRIPGRGQIEVRLRDRTVRGVLEESGVRLTGLPFYYYVTLDGRIYVSQEIILEVRDNRASASPRLGKAGELIVRELGLSGKFKVLKEIRSRIEGWVSPSRWKQLYEQNHRPDLFARFVDGEVGPVDVKTTLRPMRRFAPASLERYKAQLREYVKIGGCRQGALILLEVAGSGELVRSSLVRVTAS
ncbi:MAG: hypothetical protein QI223_03895 [Candidatus Korarchaeota archaeon]|nr:hypothetical protein [Candidatus Korarchaeota archaeon]